MAKSSRTSRTSRSYTAKFKFQVVLEVLKSQRSETETARAYGVHPVTLSKWKTQFLEQGPEIFSGHEAVHQYEQRIAELERLLGQKEVEIALLKNFLSGR